jgi:rhomboid domain-containing protein 1
MRCGDVFEQRTKLKINSNDSAQLMSDKENYNIIFFFFSTSFPHLQIGLENIPPATLLFLAVNSINYFYDPLERPVSDVCVSAASIIIGRQWIRLVAASFWHLNDMHLYYNMSSFIWKGKLLEPQLGTPLFAAMCLIFGVISNALYVAVAAALTHFFHMPEQFYSCAAGFSAVLFALKVVMQQSLPPDAHAIFLGLKMPSK